jgi:hypothetical protein
VARNLFLLQNVPTCSEDHPVTYSKGIVLLSRRQNVLGMKKHSLPAILEVTRPWIYTSASLLCLHDMDRDNFTFDFLLLKMAGCKYILHFIKKNEPQRISSENT